MLAAMCDLSPRREADSEAFGRPTRIRQIDLGHRPRPTARSASPILENLKNTGLAYTWSGN